MENDGLTLEQRDEHEARELEAIADAIRGGAYSGMTGNGSTWHLAVVFDYAAAELDD